MNPELETHMTALGFRRAGALVMRKARVPVFEMKMIKDRRRDGRPVEPEPEAAHADD